MDDRGGHKGRREGREEVDAELLCCCVSRPAALDWCVGVYVGVCVCVFWGGFRVRVCGSLGDFMHVRLLYEGFHGPDAVNAVQSETFEADQCLPLRASIG